MMDTMDIFRFEHRGQPPLSTRRFLARLARHGGVAVAVIAVSLAVGVAAYHWLAGFGWLDAFLNASMILGGMGPVGDIRSASGKVFASLYALYAGVVFLVVAALMLSPVFHRVIHRFHWDADQPGSGRRQAKASHPDPQRSEGEGSLSRRRSPPQ
jgi:hypothetical protein